MLCHKAGATALATTRTCRSRRCRAVAAYERVARAGAAGARGGDGAEYRGPEPGRRGAAAIAAAETETGLLADDPVRFGPDRLLDAVLEAPSRVATDRSGCW